MPIQEGPAPPVNEELLKHLSTGTSVSGQPFTYRPENPEKMLSTSREAGGKPTAQTYGGRTVSYQEELARDRALTSNAVQAFGFDVNLQRTPAYWIHIFNISPNQYVRYRPPQFPRIVLAPCPSDKEWVEVARIPDIVNEKEINPDTGLVSYRGSRGERFATDLVNPSNLTNNMWAEIAPNWMDGGGDDLSRKGVFWSKNEVPTREELQKSRRRMEQYYREQFQRAEDLARAGKAAEISKEMHLAADYLRLSTTWHVMTDVPYPCPNCGEAIKPGVAYHASSVGGICVIDWKRTVAAGIKQKSDVPEEVRWWTEEPEEQHRGPGRPRKTD